MHVLHPWLLFKGGIQSFRLGDYYSRGTTIRGGLLFEGDYYSRGTTIRGGLLFKADYYSRAAFISSESPRTSTMAGQGTYE